MPNDSGPPKKPVPQANGGAGKPAPKPAAKADGKKPAGPKKPPEKAALDEVKAGLKKLKKLHASAIPPL